MLIKIEDRAEALHAVINMWLKDPTKYCNNCNQDYMDDWEHCCEDPFITNNANVTSLIIKQNKEFQKSRGNAFASTQSKDLRWGLSMPQRLLQYLENYVRTNGEKSLFNEKYNVNWFCRKFPQFSIPERI